MLLQRFRELLQRSKLWPVQEQLQLQQQHQQLKQHQPRVQLCTSLQPQLVHTQLPFGTMLMQMVWYQLVKRQTQRLSLLQQMLFHQLLSQSMAQTQQLLSPLTMLGVNL
ncbi:MAG: hypothetical protein EBT28_07415 [Betaproteobacteria bacterium]|nr:hypothetical protein [Betaproteobacteria bacterium]